MTDDERKWWTTPMFAPRANSRTTFGSLRMKIVQDPNSDPYHNAAQRLAAMMAAATQRVLTLMTDAGLDMREVRIRDVGSPPGDGGPRMPPESFDHRQVLDSNREVAAELRWSLLPDGTWVLNTTLRPELEAFGRARELQKG